MSQARHPMPPEVAGLPIEEIGKRYVARFRDRKPDWNAFEDAKMIDGYDFEDTIDVSSAITPLDDPKCSDWNVQLARNGGCELFGQHSQLGFDVRPLNGLAAIQPDLARVLWMEVPVHSIAIDI